MPKWLEQALDAHSIVSVANNREVFEVFFNENNTVDSPRFHKICERLVDRNKVKQSFITQLVDEGHYQDIEESLTADAFEEEVDSDFEDAEYIEGEFEDDGEAEEEDTEDEASTSDIPVKRKPGRPRTTPLVVSQYEDTGVPSVEEVRSYVGSAYKHTEEFDNPVHLQLVVSLLTELGFSLDYDSRVAGGNIKRPRGGRFILTINVSEKRAVKRRGKTAPVLAYVEQVTTQFDVESQTLIEQLVIDYTPDTTDSSEE